MNSDEIRELFLSFFEQRGHTRLASASLVPPPSDRTVLLTTAGMQPLKPYFLGLETPSATRLTSCQKCFRTPDIEKVGSTLRHLTFFEMLGNFSIGEYFKQEAIEFAWELSRDVFGFAPQDIWVTVFAGDAELGLGPDEEAIELWQAVGVPRERIVGCARSENFWEAGAVGPSGPCSELYLDRGLDFGAAEDLPGAENERFLEFWNLVFMQYDQNPHDRLTALPARSIDTGLGLNRMAAILQGKNSVFETDQFWPLIELGQELSGQRYGQDVQSDRALRILADHARGMSFMVADGVVPSNEDRGYVLRRLMRRAIQQGRRLQMPTGFLVRYAEVVRDLMGSSYSELHQQREAIDAWLSSEEENFGRTLEQGTKLLEEVIQRALAAKTRAIPADDAFTLHDTYGFPFELTTELACEHGLSVDEEGFASLMDSQRARARAAAASVGEDDPRERARAFASQHAEKTRFVGYDTEELTTTVDALTQENGHWLVKLTESPFYPAGGGQISDQGQLICEHEGCLARVDDVFRLGDDQVLEVTLERGSLQPGERILARVDHISRHATECNHTATHLLHAALRERLGTHVRQAGSYVGPEKLRFDFSHSHGLTAEELTDVEDRVNERILANEPVNAITTTLEEAKSLGAMALFGEKYGEVVRMVQIGDGSYSRELCGGTHVRTTAEIGLLRITAETSSAANVRRIEAVTGPAAVTLLREHDRWLSEIARTLRAKPEDALRVVRERDEQRRALQRELKSDAKANGTLDVAELAGRASELSGARVLTEIVQAPDAKALLDIADRVKGKLGDSAIVLGASADGRVHLVVSVAPGLVQRGLNASELVKVAAAHVGGGGGGRETMAQAGGRYPEKLNDALKAARAAIESALGG